ncbi:unnamed protein product, partial [marine sediment metagenome]
ENWRKWTPIILLFTIDIVENEKEEEIRKSLLEIAYQHVKEEVFLALNAEIEKENSSFRRIYILDRVEDFWDEDFGNFLHNKALEEHLEVESRGNLFDFLLKKNFQITNDYVVNLLSNVIPEEGVDRNLTIRCAQALILYAQEGNWNIIWPVIQNNEEWGREILEQVTEKAKSSDLSGNMSEMYLIASTASNEPLATRYLRIPSLHSLIKSSRVKILALPIKGASVSGV